MPRTSSLSEFELFVLIGLIRLRNNAYGVPIAREIERRTGREVALASVYAALERMEEKGYVSSTVGEPTAERGGRAKRYFKPTESGLRQARETHRALTSLWAGLPEFRHRSLA